MRIWTSSRVSRARAWVRRCFASTGNRQAGIITGYNGLTGAPPLDRTELYELWWRQSFFADKLLVRIGKTVPTYDFGNVVRPVPVQDLSLRIPAVSGLLYTPVFVNPTILGALPGYYNSAYGVTATVAPIRRFYVSFGGYDVVREELREPLGRLTKGRWGK